MQKMKILSANFLNNQKIPSKYTCDSSNINPELKFSDIPETAKSLVLIMDDPDAPIGLFVHWVLFNMDPKSILISENSIPKSAIQGINSSGTNKYIGPCPPSGTHRYFFKLYALDKLLVLSSGCGKKAVEAAMEGHILEKAELMGLYERTVQECL
ncbi:MAG: YbhB/YbcL family Raf kinase inhibitor-like protein [Candidatus Levybacteria bacterium CG_4_10_14_0_2_um_filter_35_8]|nr:MAG: YbhB/YbcL family Raf kinase inhibitor-like protein [Candidatus Levybacteria bacterium CG_4_10_14_0_2_um_filter_35_8]